MDQQQYQQCWGFHAPESTYESNRHASPFAANVSSYFRRPAKVVKSTSRNSSPKYSGRRKTTTNLPVSRTRSMLDRQRSSMPHQQLTSHQQTRPLSWHPNTQADVHFSNQDYLPNMAYQSYLHPFEFYGTTSVNGLVTPMSHAVADEPQIQELITPLEELSAQEYAQGYEAVNYQYQSWLQPDMSKVQGYTMDNMFPQLQTQQIWQWNNHTSMLDIPTAPSSPTFLPIQGGIEASPLTLDAQTVPPREDDGEELVGMGLYDSPADVRSSSLLFGGGFGTPANKKPLKLEESFDPAPESSEPSVEEEDDEDAEEDVEDDDEPAAQEQDTKTAACLPCQDPASLQSSTLVGQSFLFDSEHDVSPMANINVSYMASNGYQPQYHTYGWI